MKKISKSILIIGGLVVQLCCTGQKNENNTEQENNPPEIAKAEKLEVQEPIKEEDDCSVSKELERLIIDLHIEKRAEAKLQILDTVSQIVNKDILVFENECALLTIEDWFVENGTYSFFSIIEDLNKSELAFNGYKFIDQVYVVYQNNAELSQYLAKKLSDLANNSPAKFVGYIESIEDSTKRSKTLLRPFWGQRNSDEFMIEVNNSKYKDEIINVLKNSG
ncbi:MAG: hypothetical protein R8N23_04985 [Reichenbachiella sp.]|uniref:hypothetical protein n=1 Tax=Reichenbachiella sp. TaxID=2184521 RepID=UPI0029664F0D|nr:hypothetical protein [Reichenbachiella sp.]MDW3209198.1 hypothetical protein [Reichenbachiella sp.]